MKISDAKEYFQLDALPQAMIRQAFNDYEGWTIEFTGYRGNAKPVLEISRGRVREFRTLDSAAKAVREIGFKTFTVITD